MIIGVIDGVTRVCGKAQGYRGLPVRDEVVNCKVNGPVNVMVTAWHPTPEDLAKLNAGAAVHVRIVGTTPPPMDLEVGEPPK